MIYHTSPGQWLPTHQQEQRADSELQEAAGVKSTGINGMTGDREVCNGYISILTSCIATWWTVPLPSLGISTEGRKCITITKLPSMEELYVQGGRNKANQILMGPQHLSVRLFQLLPFGRWYRSIRAWLNRRKNSGSSAIRNPTDC